MFKFRFGGQGGSSPTPPPTTIETVRRRARHRLLGATVLVLAGVIGFPLLFESQPRPVPVDFEIDIPARQAAKHQAPATEAEPSHDVRIGGLDESEEFVPAAPPVASVAPAVAAVQAQQVAKAPAEPTPIAPPVPLHPVAKHVAPESAAPAAQDLPAAKPQSKPEVEPPAKKPVESKLAEKPADKPVKSSEESVRAQALLEGKPAQTASAAPDKSDAKPRHIVQVGAFVDPKLAQEARMKLERAGLVTYTQIGNTPDGPRTRVRLGPFLTRAEAEKAAAKARTLGLSAAILAL